MDFFRQWLLGVIACALLVSIAAQVSPEGSFRAVVRFTGALLILCAVLRPLSALELSDLTPHSGYREALAQAEQSLRTTEENALANGIATGLASYIEDKAGSLGAGVRATVTVESRDGIPFPTGVTLRGAYSDTVADFVERELGIAKEHQQWIES